MIFFHLTKKQKLLEREKKTKKQKRPASIFFRFIEFTSLSYTLFSHFKYNHKFLYLTLIVRLI